jgi:hypothetical protein
MPPQVRSRLVGTGCPPYGFSSQTFGTYVE